MLLAVTAFVLNKLNTAEDVSVSVIVMVSASPVSSDTKIDFTMAAVYFVSVAGILAAFFGAQAWSNRK